MRLDPFGSWYRTTPQTTWRRLHDAGDSVGYDPELDLWVITRHDLVRAALTDSRFSSTRTLEPVRPLSPIAWQILSALDLPPVTVAADPDTGGDTHRALRAVWPHTPDRVEAQWGHLVRARVEQLVEDLTGRDDPVDLIAEIAARLPLLVTLDVLGVPTTDVPQVQVWAAGQAALTWGELDEDGQIRAALGLGEFAGYSQRLVARKASLEVWWRCFDTAFLSRADPRSLAEAWAVAYRHTSHPDAVTALRRVDQRLRRLYPAGMDHYDTLRDLGTPAVLALAEAVTVMDPDAGHHTAWERHLHALTAPTRRSRPEQPSDVIDALLRYRDSDGHWLPGPTIASLALNILAAGGETTTGLLAHSLELGLTDRTRWQQLTDPDHAAAHVEECLRLHPPIAGWLRHTRTPVTLDGITIPDGAHCLLLIGAANRDPGHFPDPDRYDPHRPNAGAHLAFGAGWHSCVGADLARLEAVTLLRELATRMPRLRLTDGYQRRYHPSIALLRHETLPALLDSRCPPTDA